MSEPSYGKARDKRRRHKRRTRLYWSVALLVIGVLIVAAAGAALAAIVVHGRGTLVAPAAEQKPLKVGEVRLSRALLPGAAADLLFTVHNPNAFGVSVDQVTLVGALREDEPARCAAKVTGPATAKAGYRLPAADRVVVPARGREAVAVRSAFRLAATAPAGCGFTVDIDVAGTQIAPPAKAAKKAPAAPPSKEAPPATRPARVTPPTGLADLDCDPAVPEDCERAALTS